METSQAGRLRCGWKARFRETALLRLEVVGLSRSDGGKLPAELSGGMIKRAALARVGIAGAVWLGPDKGPMRLPIDLLSTHSVAGLKFDAPVRFRGVDVRRVDSISFDSHQAGEIRVRIEVNLAVPISRSA